MSIGSRPHLYRIQQIVRGNTFVAHFRVLELHRTCDGVRHAQVSVDALVKPTHVATPSIIGHQARIIAYEYEALPGTCHITYEIGRDSGRSANRRIEYGALESTTAPGFLTSSREPLRVVRKPSQQRGTAHGHPGADGSEMMNPHPGINVWLKRATRTGQDEMHFTTPVCERREQSQDGLLGSSAIQNRVMDQYPGAASVWWTCSARERIHAAGSRFFHTTSFT